jgi:hypothetical protein
MEPALRYPLFTAFSPGSGGRFRAHCGMALGRRGQSTTEYMLLLCSVVAVAAIAGGALQKYLPQITERLLDAILSAAIALASPY